MAGDPPWFPSAPAVMYGGAPIDLSPRYPSPTPAQPFFTPSVVVSPPPSYAPKSELEVIDAIEKLPADQRARVLRFVTDKWPTEELLRLRKQLADALAPKTSDPPVEAQSKPKRRGRK